MNDYKISDTVKRALISAAVFAAIYWGADFVRAYKFSDMYVEMLKYLAAVIGAGCYWIGSRK